MHLYTVKAFDENNQEIGAIEHVPAWSRREAFHSVMHQIMDDCPAFATWDSIREPMDAAQFFGPAFESRSDGYPVAWADRIPLRVRMLQRVQSDLSFWFWSEKGKLVAEEGMEYYSYTNSHGAVSVWLGDTKLGVKLGEFEVIEYFHT